MPLREHWRKCCKAFWDKAFALFDRFEVWCARKPTLSGIVASVVFIFTIWGFIPSLLGSANQVVRIVGQGIEVVMGGTVGASVYRYLKVRFPVNPTA